MWHFIHRTCYYIPCSQYDSHDNILPPEISRISSRATCMGFASSAGLSMLRTRKHVHDDHHFIKSNRNSKRITRLPPSRWYSPPIPVVPVLYSSFTTNIWMKTKEKSWERSDSTSPSPSVEPNKSRSPYKDVDDLSYSDSSTDHAISHETVDVPKQKTERRQNKISEKTLAKNAKNTKVPEAGKSQEIRNIFKTWMSAYMEKLRGIQDGGNKFYPRLLLGDVMVIYSVNILRRIVELSLDSSNPGILAPLSLDLNAFLNFLSLSSALSLGWIFSGVIHNSFGADSIYDRESAMRSTMHTGLIGIPLGLVLYITLGQRMFTKSSNDVITNMAITTLGSGGIHHVPVVEVILTITVSLVVWRCVCSDVSSFGGRR